MFLNLWQRALKQPSRRFQHGCNAGRQRKPAFQPRLEILEGRTLPSTVNWIGGSGNWSDDSHWLDAMTGMNHRPTASDDAVIGTGATVTHDSGTDVVQSVTVSSGTLNLTGGALNVSGALSGAGAYRLAGGTLGNATVASGTTITGISGSTLDGVTITGTLDLATAPGVFVYVRNGLTVNGTVQLGDSAGATSGILAFMTTQTVTGSGEIVMGGSTGNTMRLQTSNITVTLDSSLNVHGKNGSFDQFAAIGTTWVNQGTIAADVSGGAITLAGGGTSWTNSNGGFSASSGATVNISSTITNTSSTLTLSGSGRVQLVNGTIIGGTVAGTLTGTNSGGTFDGVTLAGTLDLTSPGGVFAFVRNGLTVNGSVQLGDSAGATSGILAFMTTQTVTGSGEIVMGGSTGNTMRLQTSNITVTLDSSLNVHGKSGSFGQFAAVGTTWVNQGTIAADVSGGNITLAGGGTSWTNSNGGFSASSGATITIGSTITNTSSTLTLSGSGRVQLLNGAIIGGTVAGALTGIAGGTLDGVTLAGILDLTSPGGVFVYVRNGLTINGSVQLGDSAGATSGILAFMTTQTVSGSGEIVMGGSTGNTMRLQASNITVTLDSSLNVHGKSGSFDQFAAVSTTWVNQGTIAADVSGGTITLQFGPSWTNNGIFRAQNGGTLSMVQPPTNYVGRTLTGGTWQAFANSVLRVPLSSGIVTNAATIVLDGINSSFYRDGSTTDALATFATNDAAGSFTIQDGRNFTTAGDFTNNGTLGVGAGSTFVVNGGAHQLQRRRPDRRRLPDRRHAPVQQRGNLDQRRDYRPRRGGSGHRR